jgi:Sulfatase
MKDEKHRIMKIRPWLEGGGLAMLYLLPLIAIFLSPTQAGFYHQVMPITSLTRGTLIDLLLLGFLLGAGFTCLNRLKSRLLRRLLWIPVLFMTAWIVERSLAEFLNDLDIGVHLPGWARHAPWMVLVLVITLLVFASRHYDLAVRAADVFLASAGLATVFVVLPQLVVACFNHAPPEQASFVHPVRQPWEAGEPRVIWVLFDELSYNQLFEHRQPGIDLPAFTELEQESITFSQLAPVGILTEVVIPSLLTGRPMFAMKSNRQGALLLRANPETGWQNFNPQETLFAAARRQGWGAGAAGWYNPYCRLLATTLDRCYWTYQEFANGARFSRLSSQQSVLENARDGLPLVAQIENAWQHTSSNQNHKDDYSRVLKEAKSLIEDENIRLAFIHLPVPHPPGIFADPLPLAAGSEDYLGNLILADQTLAELRAVIARTPSAADTIFIVSSDHSWRVPMWRSAPGWSRSEERATNGGFFDQRLVLMVRFPQDAKAEKIDRPESAMIVHSLVLDLIQGKVRTPEQWIATLPAGTSAASQADFSKK